MSSEGNKDKFLTYRGKLRGLDGNGASLAFVTRYAEGGGGLYRLDADKIELAADELPAAGIAVLADGDVLWAACDDGKLYRSDAAGAKLAGSDVAATALCPLGESRLAALTEAGVAIVDKESGKAVQQIDLAEDAGGATALAASPDGEWLAVGTGKGVVAVFEKEGKDEFEPSASEKLHEGAVGALLFEPEELRFYSAGADAKLLHTHARGNLQPENRGKTGNHDEPISAIVHVPGERFVTGSADKKLKCWTRKGATRPATWDDGVGKVLALARVDVHQRPHLAAACSDNTIRLFRVDEKTGKISSAAQRLHDAYARAERELGQNQTARRGAALDELAGFGDVKAIDLIDRQAKSDGDHALRLKAIELLCASEHGKAGTALEGHLSHNDSAARLAAFEGLRARLGDAELRPIELALKVPQADLGTAAVEAVTQLAADDDRAMTLLVGALGAKTREVRIAAVLSLESVYPANSAAGSLVAATGGEAEVRRLALVRLFQRGFLGEPRVQAAVRRRGEDDDADVRLAAFLVSLLGVPSLATALRERDADIDRQLAELENFSIEQEAERKKPKKKAAKKKAAAKKAKADLDDAELAPLLQAMGSRSIDTCLLGGRCLALLGDGRAFGLLLQLSRESSAGARAEVCRALAALDDPRAVKRLCTLLDDEKPEVRDAAYSGLVAIHAGDPLLAAGAGLESAHEDVRGRAIETLVKAARKSLPKDESAPAWGLLLRALNDRATGISNEAFKATLNLGVAGGGADTLRFVLQSSRQEIRAEVLTEVMAQEKQAWAKELLLELFDDPFSTIRKEAFEFAIKKSRGRDVAPMQAALDCRHPDLRRLAVERLVALKTDEAQAALASAINDDDRETRLAALQFLISSGAAEQVRGAMSSEHADVRLRAACARATVGDEIALEPLTEIADAPEPDEEEEKERWVRRVGEAFDGLGALGHPDAAALALRRLADDNPTIRRRAAAALPWVCRETDSETLREALRHEDDGVKFHAALALALDGDPLAKPVLADPAATAVLEPLQQMAAVVALGESVEDRLMPFLDSESAPEVVAALHLILFLEFGSNESSPRFGIAALAGAYPYVRLIAARGVEAFSDATGFEAFVVDGTNERGEGAPDWTLSAETIAEAARLIVDGEPRTSARTIGLLANLGEEKQDAWDLAWASHRERFASEIKALPKAKPAKRPPASEMRQLVFGSYVGLSRELEAPLSVRLSALRRLNALAGDDEVFAASVQSILTQALSDPAGVIRAEALGYLSDLGMEPAALASECIESGHTDMGVAGLKILRGEGKASAKGKAALESAMLSRTDELAVEAAKLLRADGDPVAVAAQALDAVHLQTRRQAVRWLSAEEDAADAALTSLRKGLKSRYQDVREQAAFELATKKDAAAFDALAAMLTTETGRKQRAAIEALVRLGDPRTPGLLLDRIETDPGNTAESAALFEAVAGFRSPDPAGRLLDMMVAESKWRVPAGHALIEIAGYDQWIVDDLDDEDELGEDPDRAWMDEQHPRRDDILAKYLERLLELGALGAGDLANGVAWSLTDAVDPLLATLSSHPEDELRQTALKTLAWRARHRGSPTDALTAALEHRDPTSKFLAAEGLALVSDGAGLNILQSAVELLPDLDLRQRAVKALGHLADESSLELLLRLANDDGHALQVAAAEAIGHLGKTDKAEEIENLLIRFLNGTEQELAGNAVAGLRWLDTRDGWALIREKVETDGGGWYVQNEAVIALGYNDDPATRDLLLKQLKGSFDNDLMRSARRVFGEDSLEPDYACLAGDYSIWEDDGKALERVAGRGEAERIFEVLGDCKNDEIATKLAEALLRSDSGAAAAAKALGSERASAVQVAAHVLGRSGGKAPAELPTAIEHWQGEWSKLREKQRKNAYYYNDDLEAVSDCLCRLVWAGGRLGADHGALAKLAVANMGEQGFDFVRHAALLAIGDSSKKPTAKILDAVAERLGDHHPTIRALAASVLAKHDPKRAADKAAEALGDRGQFNRFAAGSDVSKVVAGGAANPHQQPVVLSHVIAAGDLKTLAAVAGDDKLADPTRLGAIEGLAALNSEAGEDALAKIAKAKGLDEELCKAAWRGLRRSKRARAKQEQMAAAD